ncbi:damage-inducible protein DinB [Hypericibacter terrae]|uniref:Damage-inducible protein DinB n=1 Tax=Hypericibacter terrae TaxID=2602015 RepID=A0A5J6MK93_9PROT|nr:DinB family protein [Hypericibacter terrae]QEX17854.1 damage-inducible protein DinB [Hypericibacter terrae]
MRHFSLMARFNQWVNRQLYDKVATLDDEAYRADTGIFFRTIHHTLNHLLVVDRLWIGRVTGSDRGISSLDQILFEDFTSLRAAREAEDRGLIALLDEMPDDRIEALVRFSTIKRDRHFEARVRDLLSGMFNHQTHHRGQIYAVMQQRGMDLPDVDLPFFLPEIGEARVIA